MRHESAGTLPVGRLNFLLETDGPLAYRAEPLSNDPLPLCPHDALLVPSKDYSCVLVFGIPLKERPVRLSYVPDPRVTAQVTDFRPINYACMPSGNSQEVGKTCTKNGGVLYLLLPRVRYVRRKGVLSKGSRRTLGNLRSGVLRPFVGV